MNEVRKNLIEEGIFMGHHDDIELYDFKRPPRFSEEDIRGLATLHETFARRSVASFSEMFLGPVGISLGAVEAIMYEEFINSLSSPCLLATFGEGGKSGSSLLQLDAALVFAMLERLTGGAGTGPALCREFTETEFSIMEGLIVRLLGNLRECATRLFTQIRVSAIDVDPGKVRIAAPTEAAVLVSFSVKLGEYEGPMRLCYPYPALQPFLGGLGLDLPPVEDERRRPALDARSLDSLRLTRYAAFDSAGEGPTARELAELFDKGRCFEFESVGRYEYDAGARR
jgi:flagellar motor switch protein FliM